MATKQYAFWKTPFAASSANPKHVPTALLNEFVLSAIVADNGELITPPFSITSVIESALRACFVVEDIEGNPLDEAVAWSLFYKGVLAYKTNVPPGPKVDWGKLQQYVNAACATYFRQPQDEYELLSSLSVKSFPAKKIQILGAQIVPKSDISSYSFNETISRAIKRSSPDGTFAGGNKVVGVKVTARSIGEAVDLATRALNFLRGVWTFCSLKSVPLSLSRSPANRPLGLFVTGMFHSLYHADGKPASDIYWYEARGSEALRQFDPVGGWDKIEKNRRWVLSKLRKHQMAREIIQLFIRYAVSLDHLDHDVSFLQMWNILETITCSYQKDETIERATWFSANREYDRELLNALRIRRNQYVHKSVADGYGDHLVFMIKHTVDNHLRQLIHNRFSVKSLEEFAGLLTSPRDEPTLKFQRKRASQILNWLSEQAIPPPENDVS